MARHGSATRRQGGAHPWRGGGRSSAHCCHESGRRRLRATGTRSMAMPFLLSMPAGSRERRISPHIKAALRLMNDARRQRSPQPRSRSRAARERGTRGHARTLLRRRPWGRGTRPAPPEGAPGAGLRSRVAHRSRDVRAMVPRRRPQPASGRVRPPGVPHTGGSRRRRRARSPAAARAGHCRPITSPAYFSARMRACSSLIPSAMT